jgi:outer membrane protein
MNHQEREGRWKPRFPHSAVVLALLAVFAMSSCAHDSARWTPTTVSPPISFAEAVQRAQPPTGPMEAEAPAQISAAEKLSNSLAPDEAIRMALERNRAVVVEAYSTDIAETVIAEARAIFDPKFSATVSYGEANTPLRASTSTGAQAGAGGSSGAGGTTSSLSLLAAETAALSQQLAALDEADAEHSSHLTASTRISKFLPTGTEVYVSGGYTQDASSVADATEYKGSWTVGVNQALLRGFGSETNLVTLHQAQNTAAMSQHAFRDFVLGLVEQVESAYWAYALAQEKIQIRKFSVDLAEEQLKLNEALIAVGKLAESALVSAEAELAAQKADLVDAEAELQVRAVDLWRLLNPEDATSVEFLIGAIEVPTLALEPPSAEMSVGLALLYRPDLAQARLSVANRDLEVVQTKNGLLPKLDAFASYGSLSQGDSAASWSEHLDDSAYDYFEVGLSFEVSLGNRAEKARHQQAKFQQGQAEAALHNLEQAIEAEVRKAIVEVVRQQEGMEASRQEVLRREEELRIETDQFRLGRSTNLDVLQVQRNLVQAKVEEATAKVGRLQSLAALYRAEGTLLARKGIVLDSNKEKTT